jgi:hypothetical protein
MHMQCYCPDISKTMPVAGGNNEGLSVTEHDMLLVDPQIGFTRDDAKHFLDQMGVSRSTGARRYPLLEYAKLRRAIAG